MRRNIIKEFEQLSESLSNYSTMFGYNLKNLCVKAEEVSLLPVQVMVEGEMQNLEKCTVIARKDDYSFMIFPKYEEDMRAVAENDQPTESDAHYLLITMPEVDDDRYDVLKKAVDALYESCKKQMEGANANADVKLATLTVDETPENMRLIKAERDKLNKQWTEHRDGLYHEKLQEIEDAHNKWLTQKADIDQKQKEEEDARGERVTYSMRMGKHDEEAN